MFWSCPAGAKPDLIQLAAAAAAAAAAGGPAAAAAGAAAQPAPAAQDADGSAQQPQQQAKQQRPPTAVESRALQWLAWAQRAVAASGADPGTSPAPAAAPGSSSSASSWDSPEAFSCAAAALAAAPPYEVPLADVAVDCPHCAGASADQLPYLLNGSLVALLGAQQAPEPGGLPQQPLRPCLGVGLVRAVDARRGLAYLLADLREEELQGVEVLQVGRLELPPSLLQCGALQSPYLALGCLAAGASGAGTIKARNNLQRVSLLAG